MDATMFSWWSTYNFDRAEAHLPYTRIRGPFKSSLLACNLRLFFFSETTSHALNTKPTAPTRHRHSSSFSNKALSASSCPLRSSQFVFEQNNELSSFSSRHFLPLLSASEFAVGVRAEQDGTFFEAFLVCRCPSQLFCCFCVMQWILSFPVFNIPMNFHDTD